MKIKITIESKRLVTITKRSKTRIYCMVCRAESDFVKGEEILVLLPTQNGAVNYEGLHKYQSIDGATMICLTSLFKNGGR